MRGVTYGTFRGQGGCDYPDREVVASDFEEMAANGFNSVRTYTVPPRWLLDAALERDLYVMVGLPWEQHVAFLDERKRPRSIERRVREGVRACAGHPAVLCYAVGNEIPAPIVRWYGGRRVERFLRRLHDAVKDEDPGVPVTYVNYPSTEYLELPFLDLVTFNVYLEEQTILEAYLARLQNLAGERPLLMAEIGLDSRRNGDDEQARSIRWQVETAAAAGCAGAFVFSWTDEWHRGGHDIEDWDFGLTTREREPKPALAAACDAFEQLPPPCEDFPRISVVVCSCNGRATLPDCFDGLLELNYPDYEVIVVNDGSTDRTAALASEYPFRVINTENRGLSSARNTGLEAATGEIVAYLDDDARPDPDWLSYLAQTFTTTDHAGVGGPNIAPAGDGLIADCVANAPGGPIHVLLSDREAEHIPGCNMAFRKECLEEIGGFDPRFRTAGDDVDVCWRLADRGGTLAFNPAALVWHHRRNSLKAYWKQQRGYGKAEALLERKWPEKYNSAGHLHWGGRLYGKGLPWPALANRPRVHYGTWGSGLFQRLYHQDGGTKGALPLMPEWYLVLATLALLSVAGIVWKPLLLAFPLLVLATGLPLGQALRGARSAAFATAVSRQRRWAMRALAAGLYLLQPLARLSGRLRFGLTPWRRRQTRHAAPWPRTITCWTERWRSQEDWIALLETVLLAGGVPYRRGGPFDRWELEVRAGLPGRIHVRAAVEEHGAGRQLARFRVTPVCPVGIPAAIVLLGALLAAATVAGEILPAGVLGGLMLVLSVLVLEAWSAAAGSVDGALQLVDSSEELIDEEARRSVLARVVRSA